jgi:ribosomal protein S18 acetylase RimI-like enzyme
MFRSLGYATDLALLRHGGSVVTRHDGYWVVTSPHNPTHYWGNVVLFDDVPTSIERAEQCFHQHFPEAQHVALGVDTTQATVRDLEDFAQAGFDVSGGVVLVAPMVASVTPPLGVTIRALHSPDDWAQSIELSMANREEQYEATGYRTYLEAKVVTQRHLCEQGHGAWWGAFVEQQLVSQMGIFDCGDGRARFQTVMTHPDYRRRGLARATLSATGHFAVEALGARELVIVAEPDYVAIDLYRSLGFVARETQLQMQRIPG